MNNKIIAIVIGLLIIFGAGGIFLFSKSSKPQSISTQTNASPTPQTEGGSKDTSLFDLISMRKNQQCTFSVKGETTTTTGVTYLSSDGKIRGNFQITSSNKNSKMYMIRVGDDNYVWGDELPTGVKMKLSLSALSSNVQASKVIDPTQKTKYICIPWTKDDSVFSIPTNVKFTDLGNIMQKTPTGSTQPQSSTNPCSAISDPTAKSACENAIKQ